MWPKGAAWTRPRFLLDMPLARGAPPPPHGTHARDVASQIATRNGARLLVGFG